MKRVVSNSSNSWKHEADIVGESESEEEIMGEVNQTTSKKRKHSAPQNRTSSQSLSPGKQASMRSEEMLNSAQTAQQPSISTSKSPVSSQRTSSISLLPASIAQRSHYLQQNRKESKLLETTNLRVEWEFVPQTQTIEMQLDDKQYILKRTDTVGELIRRIILNISTMVSPSKTKQPLPVRSLFDQTPMVRDEDSFVRLQQYHSWLEHVGGKKIDCETELEHALPKATFLHLCTTTSGDYKKTERYHIHRISPTGFYLFGILSINNVALK